MRRFIYITLALAVAGVPAVALAQTWAGPGTYYWTAPPGVFQAYVTVIGGGGGGGGGGYSGDYCSGAGGGAGGYYSNYLMGISPGSTYTVVVGSGGSGGAHGECYPGAAGASSGGGSAFSWLSVTGGSPGTYGGAGGYAGGGEEGAPNSGLWCDADTGQQIDTSRYSISPYAGGYQYTQSGYCDAYTGDTVTSVPCQQYVGRAKRCANGSDSIWYTCAYYLGGDNGTGYGAGGTGTCYSGGGGNNGLVRISAVDSCPTYASQPWSSGIFLVEPGATRKITGAVGFCVTNYSGRYIIVPDRSAAEGNAFRGYAGNVGASTY